MCFFQTSGTFLDHIVSENGVSTDPEKTRTVPDFNKSNIMLECCSTSTKY